MNAVGKEDSSVKLVKERIKLKAGQKYKVSFDVTSNPERKITWGIMNHPGGDTYTDWQAGANNIKAASNTHYDAEFECKKDSNTYQIYFSLGQMYEQNAEYELVKDRPIETKPSTVTISNLKIDLVVPETKPVSDNLIQNGDFSDKDKSWTSSIVSPGAATARFGGAAVYDITNVGTEDWNVQLKQAGLPIVTGSSYVVSFTAISTKARTIKSSIMAVSGDAYAWLGGEDVLLKENEPSNVVFYVKNVPESKHVDDKNVDVNIATADKGIFFSMGQIKDTGYQPEDTPVSTITISGITMKKISNEDAADKEDTQSNPGTKPGQGAPDEDSPSNSEEKLTSISLNDWYAYNNKYNDDGSEKEDGEWNIELLENTSNTKKCNVRVYQETKDWQATCDSANYSLEAGDYRFTVTGYANKEWNAELYIADNGSDAYIANQPVALGVGQEKSSDYILNFDLDTPTTCKLRLKLADISATGRDESGYKEAQIVVSNMKLEKVEKDETSYRSAGSESQI